jgi:type II secretory pathway component PulC
MRGICTLGLLLTLAGQAVAQDTSVVIRGVGRNGTSSGDTTIIIRHAGQPDRVVHVTGTISGDLRANLERQLEESHRAMAKMHEAAGVMEARTGVLARREDEMRAAGMSTFARRAMDTVRIREMTRNAETVAREARGLAGRTMQVFAARPRLGINVSLVARESDKFGAYVTAVTPGGPADAAGIRTGDIITRIDGKSLTTPDSIRREVGQSLPGLRLIEMVSRLEVGKKVAVELRRGSDTRKVTVLPADDDGWTYYVEGVPGAAPRAGVAIGGVPGGGGFAGRMTIAPRAGAYSTTEIPLEGQQLFESMARGATGNRLALFNAFGGPLADLELAPLNEKLGNYFGVNEGVLVIDVPEKESLGLVPGDVITAIDGRKVTTPSQLTRILRTYEKGEEFKIQVTRQKRTETLTAKLP